MGSRPISAAHQVDVDVPAKYSPERRHRLTDLALRELAASQHGVLTLDQLRERGLSERAIRDRAAGGRLRRVHRGVYALDRLDQRGRWMAAILACGERAVISHRSAGALHGLVGEGLAVDVTAPRGARRGRAGIAMHGRTLPPDDVTLGDGVPCTAPMRTLLDLAGTIDAGALNRAIARSEELRIFDLAAVEQLLARTRHLPGRAALASAVANFDAPSAATRSPAEKRFLVAIRRARLPQPSVNVWIPLPEGGGYRPDFLWRERWLIVEIDGRSYHARRAAFEHDRRRDRRLRLLGYETVRYAAREVSRSPAAVVAELACFLSAR